MADSLTVDVVIPTAQLFSGPAESVVAPAIDGSIGILARHEPTLTLLSPGEVKITTAAGQVTRFFVEEGFMSVDEDVVTVVVERAKPADN
ncbi:F0F1 ATP synthase subunit epsilon [Bogoriella caseilytica]|uniref:ATP synthase F1 subcomplex epsilon subunit n=1 Tax=Bogoriella caseilytica TaxID=56055 RepID=A0A3N2BEW8_9MICO|nr:F0F1 ATP synthase subunit epsilon [Bogoriella caseilytica]ROR73797.1 ATP synthase F1 subcomplex epsilon subunit [Bogoriella caseilytica]